MSLGIAGSAASYDQFAFGSAGWLGVGDNVGRPDPTTVAEQWLEVMADGVISLSELKKYPELVAHIEKTLGYGSVKAFWEAHLATGKPVRPDGVKLSYQSLVAINTSIFGSLDGTGVYFAEGSDNQLPEDIDPESSFVVFTLQNGQKITFDGPNAGKIANEFAKIYNNSPTFRNTMVDLANKQGGQYSFHSVPLEAYAKGQVLGFNFSGTSSGKEASGVFIQSNPSFKFNLASTIIHEVVHDLNSDGGSQEGKSPSAGESHSRQQSIIHSVIVDELKENGIDIDYDVDGDDYSQDTLVFDKSFDDGADQDSGEITSTSLVYDLNGKVVLDANGEPVNALDYYANLYAMAKDFIAQGNYAAAAGILGMIPPNATITLSSTNAQNGERSVATYNVRQLMFQDLMFAADGADRFDASGEVILDKDKLEGFFNFLTNHDTSGQWSSTIDTAASLVHYGLFDELPGYVLAGLTGLTSTPTDRG